MTYTDLALQADALCLGPHWIYDQDQLTTAYPSGVYAPSDPLSSYHPNRRAGQNTHLGDQVRFLADSIAEHGMYDFEHWKATWLAAMTGYDGYLDGASKTVLASHGAAPAPSNEFAVVARIAPVLDLELPVDAAVATAQNQARLTHGGALIPEVIEYFVRVIYRIKGGHSVAEALHAEAHSEAYPQLSPATALRAAEAAEGQDFRSVANKFGQACSLDSAFPLTLYFALFHGADPAQCLSNNALAGGDNTARAMVLAMLLAER